MNYPHTISKMMSYTDNRGSLCPVSMAPLEKKKSFGWNDLWNKKMLLCFWESPSTMASTPRITWVTPELAVLSPLFVRQLQLSRKSILLYFRQKIRAVRIRSLSLQLGCDALVKFWGGFCSQWGKKWSRISWSWALCCPLQQQNTLNRNRHLKCWQFL